MVKELILIFPVWYMKLEKRKWKNGEIEDLRKQEQSNCISRKRHRLDKLRVYKAETVVLKEPYYKVCQY